MAYDFSSLSHADFEDLVRDLIGRESGLRLGAFPENPDDGKDGWHAAADGNTILQAKHSHRSGAVKLNSKIDVGRPSIDPPRPPAPFAPKPLSS